MRNISSWSIQNPVVSIVLFTALTLAGIVSFMRLDINNDPDVTFPAASVRVVQPGAAAEELKTQVTQRVEAAVRGVNGVDEITSTIREGSSSTFIQFDIGVPIDRAVNDVRDAVASIRSDLPEGILEPQVQRQDFGGILAYMSVEAVDMTQQQLSWFADDVVAKRLLSISGMSSVGRSGGVDREIRIELDPERMQAFGVTAAQVNSQLRQLNINAGGGRAEIAGAEQSVRVLGNAADIRSLAETRINLGGGRTVRLEEIAEVADSFGEQRNVAKQNGREVVGVRLEKAKGASDVTVFEAVQDELVKMRDEYPGVKFQILFTPYDYTIEQYKASMLALIEGAILAVLVVFLFLRDWRAMLIAATAIPLSAIPTFWVMDLLGFTLNSLSLLALALVAGVLVDDAIVEIENIVRHMRMGKTPYEASMEAADEIGLAVVATTFSIVAVFLPVGLMSGITGQFFKQFGLTVVAAVLFSLAVARMVTPLMAAYFLKSHGEAKHGEGPLMDFYEKVLAWTLTRRKHPQRVGEQFSDESRGRRLWLRVRRLGGDLFRDHRVWTCMIGVLALGLTVLSFATLPFTFQPEVDNKSVQVNIEMPPGSTFTRSEIIADRVTQFLLEQPETEDVFQAIGVDDATLYVNLKDDRERSSIEFTRQVGPQLGDFADARISFQAQQNFGGGGRDVNLMIAGSDSQVLEETAQKIVAELRADERFVAPRIAGDLQRPELVISPNFALAADLGITTSALSQTIRIATIGDIDQNVAKFSLSDRQIPIRVVLPPSSRQSLDTIANLPVPTAAGGSVPLKVVAKISLSSGPEQLRRFNQQDRIIIGADLVDGIVAGEGQRIAESVPTMQNLPMGVMKPSFGMSKMQSELITQFAIATISGILLVFAVLVLLYKRAMPPFVNMGSLLLAPLGGGIALHLTGNVISMPVLIGLLMLLGIVAKNSILLIDFALEEMEKGVPRKVAIMDAGRKRAQPIVMTTIAMAAGMLPTALSLTGDGAWRAPMGIVVIGGLLLSTVLTLLIVPAGFSLADDFEKFLGRVFGRFVNSANDPRVPGKKAGVQPAE
ncbi:efflux RND transporter permease subunit [Pacificimonas sp. WHA3]|uniref:Efflux RND transporter permease subunit n=1 Tax=Pacificimonas pallii TaxID=2827236 RepID=A0ABS6SC29_9SPHN|nr:efflux RND transporter permease subunit [Pacificimonas pallii]MBV7255972.1 efflux RND transporter permease subunit [Pacificimonas pallii]